jgi:methyl-accepting chemotaxis protein
MAASVAPDDARRAGARRPALLAPVDSLLTRLPTSARLAALVTLLLIPAAFVNVAYFRTISGQVDSSLAERDGVRVLRPALTAMATTVAGRTPDLAAVESAVTDEPGLALDAQWRAVQEADRALGSASGDPAAVPAARTALVSALVDLVTETGNTSNLILDPDLDSFYVMDTLVVQIPRALLTATEAASPDRTSSRTDQVATQAVRAGTLAGAVQTVGTDTKTATDNTADHSLTARLTGLAAFTAAGTDLATRLTSTLGAPQAADPTALGAAAVTAVPDAVTALDELLAARAGRFAQARALTLSISLVTLALACWFGAGVWWRTRRDVRLVLDAVTAIAEDDLEPRPVPEGREEFGRIGRELAVARHQLGEAQQALALSQSAREEQMRANFAQQRAAEKQARERAQEVIDSTAGTVVTELNDVVAQVDAVRIAATTIDGRVKAADAATRSVVDQAREADRLVTALAGSLDQVAGMAQLIAGIADQTRLLALNATIESARAGEAGRGFSVVAQEVKNLAVTTARSTGQITQTIASLQRDAEAVATAITTMGRSIRGVDEATEVLSGVATEQHALVERLDRSVTDSMDRVQAMASLTDRLERRKFERIHIVGDVELRFGGRVVQAALTDLSVGGMRCRLPADQAPAQGAVLEVEIELPGGPVELAAHVIRVTSHSDRVQVGIAFMDVPAPITRRLGDYVSSMAST